MQKHIRGGVTPKPGLVGQIAMRRGAFARARGVIIARAKTFPAYEFAA